MTSKNGVHIEADSGAETVMDANGFVMSLTGRVRKPRSKVSKACDNCRKRKIKCNGKFPCASCEIYLCECTFTTRHGSNRIKNFQKANLNLEGATVQVKEETDSSSGSVPNPQLCADGPCSIDQPPKSYENCKLDGGSSSSSGNKDDEDSNRNGFYEDDSKFQATLASLQGALKNLKEIAHLGPHIATAIENVESQINDLTSSWEPKIRVKELGKIQFYPNKSIETQLMKNRYSDAVHLTRYAAWSNNKRDQDTSSQALIDEIFGLYSPFQFLSLQGIGKCFQNYRSKTKCDNFPKTAKETLYIMLRFFDICFHHLNQGCVSIANPLENYLHKMNLLPSTPSSVSSAGSPNTAHTKSHVALVINHLPQPFVQNITEISNSELLHKINDDTSMFGILLEMLHVLRNSYQNFLIEVTSNPSMVKGTQSNDTLQEFIHYCQAVEALIALCYSYYNSTLYNYVDFTCDVTHLEQLLYFSDLLFWLAEIYGFEKVLNVAVHFVSRVGLSRWEFYVGLDEAFAERRRSLWWKAYYFEKTLASKLGYPSNIDDSKINCLLPKDFRDAGFLDNRDFIENVHSVHRNKTFDNMAISNLKDYGELAVLQVVSNFSSSVLFNEKFTSIRNTSKPNVVREKLLLDVLATFKETELKFDAIKEQTGKLFDIAFSEDTAKFKVSREDKIIASRFVLFYEHHFCRMVNESDNVVARLCVNRKLTLLLDSLKIYLHKIYKSWTDMNTILLDFDNDYFVYRSFAHYSISCIILVSQAFSVAEFIKINDVLNMIRVFKRFLNIKIFSENEKNEHVFNSQSFKDYTRAFSFLTIVTRIMLLAYGESSSTNLDALSKYVEESAPDLKGIIELVLDTNSCAYRFLLEPVQKSGFHLTVSQMLKNKKFQGPLMSNEDKKQVMEKKEHKYTAYVPGFKANATPCSLNGNFGSPQFYGRSAPSPVKNNSIPEFAQLPSYRSLSVSEMINPDNSQATKGQNCAQTKYNSQSYQPIYAQQDILTQSQPPFVDTNDNNNNNDNNNSNNNNNNNNINNQKHVLQLNRDSYPFEAGLELPFEMVTEVPIPRRPPPPQALNNANSASNNTNIQFPDILSKASKHLPTFQDGSITAPDKISQNLSKIPPLQLIEIISNLKILSNQENIQKSQLESFLNTNNDITISVTQALLEMGFIDYSVVTKVLKSQTSEVPSMLSSNNTSNSNTPMGGIRNNTPLHVSSNDVNNNANTMPLNMGMPMPMATPPFIPPPLQQQSFGFMPPGPFMPPTQGSVPMNQPSSVQQQSINTAEAPSGASKDSGNGTINMAKLQLLPENQQDMIKQVLTLTPVQIQSLPSDQQLMVENFRKEYIL